MSKIANTFVKLSTKQLDQKYLFIQNYKKANNAAEGSNVDANSNVATKNVATMMSELNKDINIQIKRYCVSKEIEKMWGKELAEEYNRQIEAHEIYVHDESAIYPYCVSITMYPFLLNGLKGLGGDSIAPKHLISFCGSFINLCFAISSQFCGALATVEFLMYFDYFARKDFGDNYLETNKKDIENAFQQVVYSLNQPAAARGYQSIFWNISIFDKYYLESLFGELVFPDFTKPNFETITKLQKFFMNWFNEERRKALLTFPVVTAAMVVDKNGPKDEEFLDMCAEQDSKGNSFFKYESDSVDSLASCCFEGKEFINVFNKERNTFENYSLEEFVKKYRDNNFYIKSFNPETLKEEETLITNVLEKKNDYQKLIEIRVEGNIIRVTPDHVFLVKEVKTGKLKEIQAFELYNNKDKYLIPVE